MPVRKVLSTSAPEKKPSLASLKSGKPKSAAARKKAVQKIEDAHSIKKTTKKVVSSRIVKKKPTDKTTGLSVKRVSRTKKTAPVINPDPVLVLPSNMSIRAREKALVILEQMTKDFGKSAEQIAYVSGLCFILLGASMSFAFSDAVFKGAGNVATISSSTLPNLEGTTSQVTQPIVYPDVSLINSLPQQVVSFSKHKLAVVNVKSVYVKARSLETGKIVQLPTDDLSSELYEFAIDPAKLGVGAHDVMAFFEATDGSKHDMRLGSIFVPPPPGSTSGSGSTSTSTSQSTSGSTGSSSETSEEDSEESVPSTVNNTVSSTTTKIIKTATTSPQSVNGPSISIDAPEGDISGEVLVKTFVSPTNLAENVRFYVRRQNTTQRVFVGTAERYPDFWRFYFNTTNIQNGEYELFAVVAQNGKQYYSKNTEKIKVANFVKIVEEETEEEAEPASEEEVNEASDTAENNTAPVVTQSGRSLPDFSITDVQQENENEELLPVTVEVADVILQYESAIKGLLNRYAVALQSGDALMLEIAKREIETGKRKIVEEVLTDKSISFLADDVERILDERFEILEKRVATFEELRKTATNNESSIDTDKDGVSDVDEKTLYNTDPTLPDSDNDGVLDGIEIMKGFNPTDPSSEAVIVYEMPQQSVGLVEDTVLKIETVVPVIKTLDTDETKQIHAEIKGTALPNSYVTLYIFSTPTIITVRADENGLFSYIFDKELEDGEHEVYVAITDNTGAIMARSNPFSFVKKAEAFTPIDTSAGEVVATQEMGTFTSMNSYNTVVGLGILAFGLILLMLGVSMRERNGRGERVIEKLPAHDGSAA